MSAKCDRGGASTTRHANQHSLGIEARVDKDGESGLLRAVVVWVL